MYNNIISSGILNAHTMSVVVEYVNEADSGDINHYYIGEWTGSQLAGQYAYLGAEEAGYEMGEDDFYTHLEFLEAEGAVFDFSDAIEEAFRVKGLITH